MENNMNENAVARQAFEPVSITVARIYSVGCLCTSSSSDDPSETTSLGFEKMTGSQLF